MGFPGGDFTGIASIGGAIVAIVIGLLNCFFGYRLFKIILGIWGFIAGAILGAGIATTLSGELWVAILAGLVGGILGAVLFVLLYFVGIFLLGAGLGFLLGVAIASTFNLGGPTQWIIAGVLAIVGGIVAVIVQKFMIILSTAFGGAAMTVGGIYTLAGGQLIRSIEDLPATMARRSVIAANWLLLLFWLLLGIVGVVVQYAVTAREKPEPIAPAPVPPPPPA